VWKADSLYCSACSRSFDRISSSSESGSANSLSNVATRLLSSKRNRGSGHNLHLPTGIVDDRGSRRAGWLQG